MEMVRGAEFVDLTSAMPGRKNMSGEIVWVVAMPPQPTQSESNAAAQARHLKVEPIFTIAYYRTAHGRRATFILVVEGLTGAERPEALALRD